MIKLNFLNFNREMINFLLIYLKEKKYIVCQILNWIYKKYCFNFNKMYNISLKLRKKLNTFFNIKLPIVVKKEKSNDGVIKWLLNVNGDYIETVYIPENKRNTLCISTQVGCMVNCNFCGTGKKGFKRNLFVSEIIGQVLLINLFLFKNFKNRITNIVFMGMGEPLFNFINVVNSIKIMLDKYCFNFSKRKIVLSTSGIVPKIYRLINYVDIIITFSLHAPNNFIRNKIIPINKKYDIYSVLDSISYYIYFSKANKKKINIEYIMLYNINDSNKNVYELINLLKYFNVKINLINFNNINKNIFFYKRSNNIVNFYNILNKNGIFTFIRKIRGNDIKASCGQLTGELN